MSPMTAKASAEAVEAAPALSEVEGFAEGPIVAILALLTQSHKPPLA
ncbi:MAG: hypothetical protein FD126_3628 [Elusimicrobia bacterium]|nr:MAG: hypothetical protein FD126_3628 [Elusimicrobiota bacterium]